MTPEEYKEKIKSLDEQLELSKGRLAKKYAFSNNDVSKGDFVTDHQGTVLVDMIQVAYGGQNLPQCVYSGAEYTKKGKPKKNGNTRGVWQCNLINNCN